MVAETHAGGKSVALAAKSNGISPGLFYSWRRQALRGGLTPPSDHLGAAFMPISGVEDGVSGMAAPSSVQRRGLIEIDLGDGRQVGVDRDVNASALRRVLGVLSGR